MRRVFILGLTLALILAGCGVPAVESPSPQPSTPGPSVIPSAPIETATPTPKPSPTGGPNVYTDWSKLEARDDAPRPTVYTRWYGEFTDHLIPSDDYGPLISFSGTLVVNKWGGEYALQGLMTLDGKVVVDPVYAGINQLCAPYAWDLTSPETYFPAFVLSRYAGDGENLFGGHRDLLSRLCAADGSWVTQREYRFSSTLVCYGMINGAVFGLRDGNVLVMLDISTGEETFAVTLDGLNEEALSNVLYAAYGDGRITTRATYYDDNSGYLRTSAFYCWDESGNEIPLPADVSDLSPDGFSEGLCPAKQSSSGLWGYLNVDGEWAILPQFSDARSFRDGVALLGGHAHTLIDKQGNILYETPVYDHCFQSGDYWYFTGYSGDAGLVLDREGNEVVSPALHGGAVESLDYGWAVMDQPDGSQLLIRGTESWPIPAMWKDLFSWDVTEDAIFLSYFGEYAPGDRRPRWLMWRPEDGDIPHLYDPRVRVGSFGGLNTDPITGDRYFTIHNDDGTYSVYTPDGETLFDGLDFRPHLYGGRFLTSRSENGRRTVELLDEKGNVLFYRQWKNPFD